MSAEAGGFAAVDLMQFAGALAVVLGLIGLAAMAARRFGLAPMAPKAGGRRLRIIEVLPLDGKRRLVLVRCDHVDHLLLLGATGETLIERDVAAVASDDGAAR